MLLYDGRIKLVEDIREGDLLMGDDNKPRMVTRTVVGNTGVDAIKYEAEANTVPMKRRRPPPATYRVTPHDSSRLTWTCNGKHILVLTLDRTPMVIKDGQHYRACVYHSLRRSKIDGSLYPSRTLLPRAFDLSAIGSYECRLYAESWARTHEAKTSPPVWEVTIEQFNAYDSETRRACRMFAASKVEFESLPLTRTLRTRLTDILKGAGMSTHSILSSSFVEETAWLVGLYLNDSTSMSQGTSRTAKAARLERWFEEVAQLTHSTANVRTVLTTLIQAYGIRHQQGVPADLMREDIDIRHALLNGLIDGGNDDSHVEASNRSFLIECQSLARSLGRSVGSIVESSIGVWKCKIDRESSSDPILSSSLSSREASYRHLVTGFDVTRIDHSDYFGFTLDGNGRCLLSDFIVTHNTNVEGLSKQARAAMMEEGIAINESLRMLKSVFRILGEQNKPLEKGKKAEIVQYRGNMLTELMQDSLGGNAKTLMFVNVGPAASNISETVDSLAYGDLVKNITNEKVSADADNEEQIRFLSAQLRAYEAKFGPLDG